MECCRNKFKVLNDMHGKNQVNRVSRSAHFRLIKTRVIFGLFRTNSVKISFSGTLKNTFFSFDLLDFLHAWHLISWLYVHKISSNLNKPLRSYDQCKRVIDNFKKRIEVCIQRGGGTWNTFCENRDWNVVPCRTCSSRSIYLIFDMLVI